MHKLFTILFLLFHSFLFAQKQDEIKIETIEEPRVVEEKPAAEYNEEKIDTVLRYHNITVSIDSLFLLKNNKKYKWNQTIDSLLRDAKEKELNLQKKREGDRQTEKKKEKPKGKPGEYENEDYEPGSNWSADFVSSPFVNVLLIAGGIFLVGFIIYKLFLSDGAFRGKSKKNNAVVEGEDEVVELNTESDFDRQIRLAVEQRNYRLAVRYQYLKTLHLLAAKNFISLSSDKTNFDYVNEMVHHPLRNGFASLTLNYDYVWYGEFDIDEIIYHKLDNNFREFNSSM